MATPTASPTAILAIVAQEPALVRWLHSLDPDRDMSSALLKASATYISKVPLSDSQRLLQHTPIPPTASLIVPMYARKNYVLGQLYGAMSPNAATLNALSHEGYAEPPHPICRRFVVDLSFPDALAFLEYEWLSDGKLCVSMHNISHDGQYAGDSILLASPTRKPSDPVIEKADLLGRNRAEHPTKVLMRIRINELSNCPQCDSNGVMQCACPTSTYASPDNPKRFTPPSDWETWLAAFTKSRTGPASMRVNFTLMSEQGNHDGSGMVTLEQDCELGVEPHSPHGSELLKMFFNSLDMLLSHPCTDDTVRSAEEKRDRIAIANALSEDEDWTPPKVVLVEKEGDTLEPETSDDCIEPVESSEHDGTPIVNEADFDPRVQTTTTSSAAKRRHNSRQPLNGKANQSWNTYLETDTVSDGAISVGKKREGSVVEGERPIQKSTNTTKRKGKQKQKLFICDCGKVFRHRGHYNEHRLCVHEKVRTHQCSFPNCQSRFFKKSDRDRHMRSKHDSSFAT